MTYRLPIEKAIRRRNRIRIQKNTPYGRVLVVRKIARGEASYHATRGWSIRR